MIVWMKPGLYRYILDRILVLLPLLLFILLPGAENCARGIPSPIKSEYQRRRRQTWKKPLSWEREREREKAGENQRRARKWLVEEGKFSLKPLGPEECKPVCWWRRWRRTLWCLQRFWLLPGLSLWFCWYHTLQKVELYLYKISSFLKKKIKDRKMTTQLHSGRKISETIK